MRVQQLLLVVSSPSHLISKLWAVMQGPGCRTGLVLIARSG